MRILVTGAGGKLGGRLAVWLAAEHRILAGRHVSPPPRGLVEVTLNLLSADSMESAVAQGRPEAIVHCAALADVERCEVEPEQARRLNVEGSAVLARLCRRLGLRLIAVSTDLVFGGDRSFVREEDPPAPGLVYARTKLEGEEAVLGEDPGAAVVRVALVHGRGHGPRPTASEAVAWSLRAGRPARLFADLYRTPVDPESVADALRLLLAGSGSGRFHLGGSSASAATSSACEPPATSACRPR